MTSRRTRDRLIQRLRQEGIKDQRILDAIRMVPRHLFVDEALSSRAYEDSALPIGFGQTISQPYIVALMTQALIAGEMPRTVLEIGTGSGYQTAVLASLVDKVFTVERVETLMESARRRLRTLKFQNVQFKLADGNLGWLDGAPFDAILVTAAPREMPKALIEQMTPDGRMVIPVGDQSLQELLMVRRTESGISTTRLELVNFVPLIRDEN
jgi:protein-L-isoaspartate(D-aspartate) O-methyltransferase